MLKQRHAIKVIFKRFFSIFGYEIRLDQSLYDLYVKYVGRMRVKNVMFLIKKMKIQISENTCQMQLPW